MFDLFSKPKVGLLSVFEHMKQVGDCIRIFSVCFPEGKHCFSDRSRTVPMVNIVKFSNNLGFLIIGFLFF
jgi:hypothetical protein